MLSKTETQIFGHAMKNWLIEDSQMLGGRRDDSGVTGYPFR